MIKNKKERKTMSNNYDIEIKMDMYDGSTSLEDVKKRKEEFKEFSDHYLQRFDEIIKNYDEYMRDYEF